MSKKGVKIEIPDKYYAVMEKFAEEYGYESVDDFVATSLLEYILHLEGKKPRFTGKELLSRYYQAKEKQPGLKFVDFLESVSES